MSHPFPFIKELYCLMEIKTFTDVVFLMDFVYSIVPWTIKNSNINLNSDIKQLYEGLKKKEIGGWCGFTSIFLKILLDGYKIPNELFNHGLAGYSLTHMGVIITLNGIKYYIDPYFCKYYTDKSGDPLVLDKLLYLIQERKFNEIISRHRHINKNMQTQTGWDVVTSYKFESIVLEFFKSMGMDNILKKIFGGTNSLLLMLIKIPPTVKKEDFEI
jgi:hypothetical protein